MMLMASSVNEAHPQVWSIPLSVHGPDLPVTGTFITDGDWSLALVLSGGLSSPSRLSSLKAPFVACLRRDERVVEGVPGMYGMGFVAVFRPQIVNQEIANFLSVLPADIDDPFMSRDVALVRPFVTDSGLCRELDGKDAEFLSILARNTWDLCASQSDPYWPCRSRSFFLEILVFLLSSGTARNVAAKSRAAGVRDFIHTHYQSKLSLDAIACHFGTNRTSLQRQFQAEYGESVFEYLSSYRFSMSQMLMRNTELSLREIAHRVGYNDYSHFFREFSGRFGVSPAAWRNGDSKVAVY